MKFYHSRRDPTLPTLFALACLVLSACTPIMAQPSGGKTTGVGTATADLHKINHVIVIYQENWSFDSLYGYFPGANGLANASSTQQMDKAGKAYDKLPQPLDTTTPMANQPNRNI